MAIPTNYIDKITKDGESRDICPAADKVRVNNDNFDGENLDEVLDEMKDAIDDAASQGGIQTETDPTVPSHVKNITQQNITDWNNKYTKPNTGIPASDLAESVQDTLDDVNNKANSSEVVKGISVNNVQQTKDPNTGNVNIEIDAGGQVSVTIPDPADGTFTINVGDNHYIINLNHTHEDMAKLVVDTAANLPDASEMESDTIYGEVEDGEIAVLYVGGIPFYGGGGATSGPVLRRPADGSTIYLGETVNGSVSKQVNIKGKGLTQSLLVQFGSGSTGYSFDTSNLPTGVTYDSNTGILTITDLNAVNSVNGIDIDIVYTGNDFDAEGTLGIDSSSVDGIHTSVTLIANDSESAGLLGYWDGSDAATNGAWVDRINSMGLSLEGSAVQVSDGYELNNLNTPKSAYMLLDPSMNTLLNNKVMTEFTCEVDCKVKFNSTDKKAFVIDFGGFGTSLSGISINFKVEQDGDINATFKHNGNNLTGFSSSVLTAASGMTFGTGAYVDIHAKLGARITQEGKQELYAECGTGKIYAVLDTPEKVNFSGVSTPGGNITSAFALGIGYMPSADLVVNAPDALSDVVYKKILLYNKAK